MRSPIRRRPAPSAAPRRTSEPRGARAHAHGPRMESVARAALGLAGFDGSRSNVGLFVCNAARLSALRERINTTARREGGKSCACAGTPRLAWRASLIWQQRRSVNWQLLRRAQRRWRWLAGDRRARLRGDDDEADAAQVARASFWLVTIAGTRHALVVSKTTAHASSNPKINKNSA